MNDELKAAAKRLATIAECDRSDYGYMDGHEGSHNHVDDLATLAHWALPLLDQTPIDAEWLKTIMVDNETIMGRGGHVRYHKYDDHRGEVVWANGMLWHWEGARRKRGELRLLCAALQIPLKESEARQ